MSEKTDRPGWKWARWRAGSCGGMNPTTREFDRVVATLLDDERRALVRSVPDALVALVLDDPSVRDGSVSATTAVMVAVDGWADAVLRRLDEGVEEVRGE